MQSLLISVLVGGSLGAILGYFGKCTTGACPLTANPWRGALYGVVLGLMFHVVYGRSGGGSAGESTPNVKLIAESDFDSEVLKSGTPVVVDFFATWCGPCKRLSPMLNELAGPVTNRVKFVKVDIDQSSKLAGTFNVEAVPTLLFFHNGKVVDKIIGLPPKESLERKLERLAASGDLAGDGR